MNKLPPTFVPKEELWNPRISLGWRVKAIVQFLDELVEPIGDMGEPNPMRDLMEVALKKPIVSIDEPDFDTDCRWGNATRDFGTVFCFAVLEHLFNPLLFLKCLRWRLRPGGVVYLSFPQRPHFLWTSRHFHEIDDMRARWLFERAGFRVTKHKRALLRYPWWFHFTGIRPLLRLFLSRWSLYKLEPLEECP